MDIGLTAKVKPEIDDRESDRQASKLQSKMEEAVSDLPTTMDLDSVLDMTSQMKEDVEEMTDSLDRVGNIPMPDGGTVTAGAGPGTQAGPQIPDQAMGGFGQDSDDDAGPTGLKGKMQEMTEQQGGMVGRMGEFAGQMEEQNGMMGKLSKGLLGGAAAIAITGLALGYLSDTVDALSSTSPLLGQVVDMIGLATSLFLRPIATTLGQYLLPLATGMLQLASEFNTVFQEQGIADALAFLSMEILTGLANMVLSVDIIGGLMDMGEMAVLGSDGDFGFADAVRIALMAAIGKAAIGKVLSRGIMSMLPRITGAKLLNWLAFPKLGTFIANRLGSTMMKASITEILEAGFRQLLQRAFGPVVANASFKTLWQAAFRTLMSKIPSFGVKAFLTRLMPSIGKKGVLSTLGSILPSIGGKALLKKVGLSSILKLLSGRLAYAIPVVGQIIGIVDLLVMLLTALIPGVEMFSPINWVLTQTYNILTWILGGLLDLGKSISQISFNMGQEFGKWLQSISISGMQGYMGSKLDEMLGTLDSIWQWFLSSFQPVLDFIQPVLMLLGIFAALGMEFYEMMMSKWSKLKKWLGGTWEQLKNLSFEDVTNALGDVGGDAADSAVSGAVSLGEWMFNGTIQLGEWMWSGAVALGEWMWSGTVALGSWLWSGTVSLGKWLWSGTVTLGQWLWGGTVTLGQWMWDGSISLGQWLWSGTVSLGQWLFSSTVRLGQWLWSSTIRLGQWMWSGATWLGQWMWNGTTQLGQWMWSGSVALGQWLWSGAVGLGQWIWSGSIGLGTWLFNGSINISDYVVGSIKAKATQSTSGNGSMSWKWTGLNLATGGIATGPTTAMIGEGSEPEAVMPLSKLEQFVSPPESSTQSVSSQTLTVDVNLSDTGNSSSADIADAIRSSLGNQLDDVKASVDELAREIRRNGMVGDIKITADGKVIAEVGEDGKDKYKRTREVNR